MILGDNHGGEKNSVQQYLKDVREKVPPHWLVWEEIMEKMEDAKRMQVLNRDTMIDTCLKDLLFFQFSREEEEVEELLFDPKRFGPLSTMPNKAKMAYALSLIDKRTLNDLGKIHNIRNKFAHIRSKDSFENEIITDLVEKIKVLNNLEPRHMFQLSTLKGKFITVVAVYVLVFQLRINEINRIPERKRPAHSADKANTARRR